jgi:hypothetical protein
MAQGDTTDRQPGAGVEEMFLFGHDGNQNGTAPNEAPSFSLSLIDGTNNDALYFANGTAGTTAYIMYQAHQMADNTDYFRITHQGSGTKDYGFATIVQG